MKRREETAAKYVWKTQKKIGKIQTYVWLFHKISMHEYLKGRMSKVMSSSNVTLRKTYTLTINSKSTARAQVSPKGSFYTASLFFWPDRNYFLEQWMDSVTSCQAESWKERQTFPKTRMSVLTSKLACAPNELWQ